MSDGSAQGRVSKRIVAVLRLFADGQDSFSIDEISTRLGIAPSTVHRLLAGLVDENLIERTARRRYCIGREFSRIGALAARKMSVRRLARPMLQHLLAATGETVMLGVVLQRPAALTVADKFDSVYTLRYSIQLNMRRPLLWGALGRVVLAWLEADEVAEVLAAGGNAPGSGDLPPDRAALDAALRRIRRDGYAITRGHMIAGAIGLAAPVFDADDRCAGVLGVTIPEIRFRRWDEQRLASLLIEQASQLSAALGSRGAPDADRFAAPPAEDGIAGRT